MPNTNHHFHLRYFLRKEINELYVMNAIRSFADSMISIFVPIFLLKQGFALSLVLLYLLSWSIFAVVFCFIAFRLISKFGVKHMIFASIPITILYFLSLHQFSFLRTLMPDLLLTIFLGFMFAASIASYWMGFHLEFARFSSEVKSTKQLGVLRILSTVFAIFGPLVGALIITYFSFNMLFLIVMILLVISVIVLFFSKETHEPFKFSMRKALFRDFKKGFPYIAEAFQSTTVGFLWPVLLFVFAISLNEIGGLYVVSNTALVLFTWFVSRQTTTANRHLFLNLGAFIHSLTLTVRVFLKTIASIAVVQGIGGLSITMLRLPFHTIFYNNSKKRGFAQTIFFREVYLTIGRLIMLSILLVAFIFLPIKETLILGVLMGAIGTMFMTRLREE